MHKFRWDRSGSFLLIFLLLLLCSLPSVDDFGSFRRSSPSAGLVGRIFLTSREVLRWTSSSSSGNRLCRFVGAVFVNRSQFLSSVERVRWAGGAVFFLEIVFVDLGFSPHTIVFVNRALSFYQIAPVSRADNVFVSKRKQER